MARTLVFSLICLCLFFCTTMAHAQRAVVSADKAKGSFLIENQGPASIQVYYSVTPASPDNLTFMLSSQSEFSLNAHVVNVSGQEVMPIGQTQVSGRYASSLDMASLQPGQYFIEISTSVTEDNKYRVPFDIAKQ